MLQAINYDENHFHMLCYQCSCTLFHFDLGIMLSVWRSYRMGSNEVVYLYLHSFRTSDDDLLSIWFHIHKRLTLLMSTFIYNFKCELYGRIYFGGMHCFQQHHHSFLLYASYCRKGSGNAQRREIHYVQIVFRLLGIQKKT